MANPIERASPFYVNDNKIGEATEGSFDVDGAITMEIGDDQIAFAAGRVTIKAEVSTFVPVAGMKYKLDAVCEKQSDVVGQFFYNGAFRTFEGKMSGYSGSWNHAKGTCSGKWSFMGVLKK